MIELPTTATPSAGDAGEYELARLLDRKQMQVLLENFCDAVGIGAAIIDRKGEVFVGARWQRICTDFHRVHPETLARCIESDTTLATQMKEGENFSIYRCPQGLTDAASPIVVNGRHVANCFVGQFLLEEADRECFRRQAEQYGFDTDDYLQALEQVPVVREDRLPAILGFLTGFAELAATIASERARAADERVHLILKSTSEGVFGVDTDGKIIFVNPAACRMLGFREDELIGQPSHALIHHHRPDGNAYPVAECPMFAAYSRGEASRIDNEFLWRKDGSGLPVEYGATPIVEDGSILGAVISFVDITERKRAEESSQRSQRLLQSVMDNTNALIYVKAAMLLTSARTAGDAARAKAVNVFALLTKPIKQSTLLDAICTAIGSQDRPAGFGSRDDAAAAKPLKILLAEDHPPNQQLAVRLLERRGHSVVVANNGLEALAALENESFDMLLTDIQMREMDGFAATEEIRRREAKTGGHLPIVAMAGVRDRLRSWETARSTHRLVSRRQEGVDSIQNTPHNSAIRQLCG